MTWLNIVGFYTGHKFSTGLDQELKVCFIHSETSSHVFGVSLKHRTVFQFLLDICACSVYKLWVLHVKKKKKDTHVVRWTQQVRKTGRFPMSDYRWWHFFTTWTCELLKTLHFSNNVLFFFISPELLNQNICSWVN